MSFCYEYPRPAVCVDIILIDAHSDSVLLIQRKNEPFRGFWAFPGGFVDENEDLLDAANRELYEETMVKELNLQQFKTYGKPGRDPRGHVISVVFYGICSHKPDIQSGDDAKNAEWFSMKNLPKLAFDHEKIISEFMIRLKNL